MALRSEIEESFTLDLSAEAPQLEASEDQEVEESFTLGLDQDEPAPAALKPPTEPPAREGIIGRGVETEVNQLRSLGTLAAFAGKSFFGLDTSEEAAELTAVRQRRSELASQGLGEEIGSAALSGVLQAGETLAVAGPVGMINPLAGIAVAIGLPTIRAILEKYADKNLVEGLSRGESLVDTAAYGAAAGLLNFVGMKGLLEPGTSIGKKILDTTLLQGAEEYTEAAFEAGYDMAVRGTGPAPEELVKTLFLNLFAGTAGGAVLGGPMALQVKKGERDNAKSAVYGMKEGIDKGLIKFKPHEVGMYMKKLDDFRVEVDDPEFDTVVEDLQKSLLSSGQEAPQASIAPASPSWSGPNPMQEGESETSVVINGEKVFHKKVEKVTVVAGEGTEVKTAPKLLELLPNPTEEAQEKTAVLPEELKPVEAQAPTPVAPEAPITAPPLVPYQKANTKANAHITKDKFEKTIGDAGLHQTLTDHERVGLGGWISTANGEDLSSYLTSVKKNPSYQAKVASVLDSLFPGQDSITVYYGHAPTKFSLRVVPDQVFGNGSLNFQTARQMSYIKADGGEPTGSVVSILEVPKKGILGFSSMSTYAKEMEVFYDTSQVSKVETTFPQEGKAIPDDALAAGTAHLQLDLFGPVPLAEGTVNTFFGPSSPWRHKPKGASTFGAVLLQDSLNVGDLGYSINPDGSLPRAHEAEGTDPLDVARKSVGDMEAAFMGQIPGNHGGYFMVLKGSLYNESALPYDKAIRKVAQSKGPFKLQDLKVLATAESIRRAKEPPWVELPGKYGTQGGTLQVSPEGEMWFVKPAPSLRREQEVLAGALYRRGGVLTPEIKQVKGNIASRWIDGTSTLGEVGIEKVNKDDLAKGFLTDVWLANWDVAGAGPESPIGNLLVHTSGRTIRVDFGGALEFRGMGTQKGKAFGDIPTEHETLRDPKLNPSAASVFEGLTEDDIATGLDSMNAVSDAELKAFVGDEALWSKLVNRRRWLNSKFGKPELYGADGRFERIEQGIFDDSLHFVKPAFSGFRKKVKLERGQVEILSPTKDPMHKAVKNFVGKEFMKLVPRAKLVVSFNEAWAGTTMDPKVQGDGTALAFKDHTYVVHLNTDGQSPAELYEILGHELGHVLMKERLGAIGVADLASVMASGGSNSFGEAAAQEVSKWFVQEGTKPLGPAEKFFSGLAQDLKGLGLPPPDKFIDGFVRDLYPGPRLSVSHPNIQRDAKKFGRSAKLAFGLHQNAKRNRGVPGIVEYTELNAMFSAESTEWYTRAVERMKAWVNLGKTEAGRVRTLIDGVNQLDHWPTEAEFDVLVKDSRVGVEGLGMYISIRQDFEEALADVEVKMLEDIEQSYTNPAVKIAEAQLFMEQMEAYRKRPYFPQSRFGEYIVIVKDAVTQKTLQVEAQESEGDQKRAFAEMQKKFPAPQYELRMSKFTPPAYAAVGLPPGLLKRMTEALHLDPSQTQVLEDLSVRLSPSSGFKGKFLKRKGIGGYSQDAIRAYGDYFWRLGRGLARVKFSKPMQMAIAQTTEAAHGPGDTTKAGTVAAYLNDHYKELMNPSDDWPKLRGAISTWIFGGIPRTGIVNWFQVPMVAYPHLAARFGDAKAIKALSNGYAALRALYTGRPSALADKRMLKLAGLAHVKGITNESQAMELAGLSTEGILQHGLLGFGYHQKMRQTQATLMFFMRESEQLNRRVVFRAAAGLALENSDSKYVQEVVDDNKIQYKELLEKGLTPEEAGAYLVGADSTRSSMWEYARYNRPRLFQGGKAVPAQFLSYTQNLLWFMRYAPGRGRALALHLLVGGLAAIPGVQLGAEFIEKIIALFGDAPERVQLDKELTEFLDEYSILPPDLLLHGLGHSGFGLGVDISPSFSMGRVVPGLNALFRPQIDANAAIVESLGISASIARDMFDVLGANGIDDIRLSSLLLPPAFQNIRKAAEIATTGVSKDSNGLPLGAHDPALPAAVARAFGLNLTKDTKIQEVLSLQHEQDEHIKDRKSMIYGAWTKARHTGDDEMMAAALRARDQFNNDLKDPSRSIRAGDLREAYRTFVKSEVDRERLERRGQRAGTDREIREAFLPK